MNWEQFVRKITSRKFWLAVVGFVTGLLLYTGHSEAEAGRIGELVLSGASVIAYIIGEGLADACSTANANETEDEDKDDDPETDE